MTQRTSCWAQVRSILTVRGHVKKEGEGGGAGWCAVRCVWSSGQKPRDRKQDKKRLRVSFYLLFNEGITASLCFHCCFQPVFKLVRDLPSCSHGARAGFEFTHVYPRLSIVKDSLNKNLSLNATCCLSFCCPDWLLLPSFCSYTVSYYLILRTFALCLHIAVHILKNRNILNNKKMLLRTLFTERNKTDV